MDTINNKPLVVLIVAVSVSWVVLLASAKAPRTPQARVWAICKNSSYPLLCYKTIFPRVGPAFTLKNALLAEVSETQRHVTQTVGLIAGLLAKPGNSKDLNDCLSICKEQYETMLDDTSATITIITQAHVIDEIYDVQNKLSAVMSYNSACSLGFEETVNLVNPIAKEMKDTDELAANSRDILVAIANRESRRMARAGGNKNNTVDGVGIGGRWAPPHGR